MSKNVDCTKNICQQQKQKPLVSPAGTRFPENQIVILRAWMKLTDTFSIRGLHAYLQTKGIKIIPIFICDFTRSNVFCPVAWHFLSKLWTCFSAMLNHQVPRSETTDRLPWFLGLISQNEALCKERDRVLTTPYANLFLKFQDS